MYLGSHASEVAFCIAAASIFWSLAYAWAKWLSRPQPPAELTSDAERRLQALEVAVDTVAIEIERIGEAQRFTSRLLEERLPLARPASAPNVLGERGRIITPH